MLNQGSVVSLIATWQKCLGFDACHQQFFSTALQEEMKQKKMSFSWGLWATNRLQKAKTVKQCNVRKLEELWSGGLSGQVNLGSISSLPKWFYLLGYKVIGKSWESADLKLFGVSDFRPRKQEISCNIVKVKKERKVFISFIELSAFLEEPQRSRLDNFLGRLQSQTFFLNLSPEGLVWRNFLALVHWSSLFRLTQLFCKCYLIV